MFSKGFQTRRWAAEAYPEEAGLCYPFPIQGKAVVVGLLSYVGTLAVRLISMLMISEESILSKAEFCL